MLTFVAFITAILILVSLHELGHYSVARLCGVKVLRFSIGFGTPFYRRQIGDTEWVLAPIPLGGYVRMVDTREGEVAPEDRPYAFDLQPVLKRIAIVAAGPLTNLLLAVLLYALVFSVYGVTETRPWVGSVEPNSIAARAGFAPGDKIQAVNGHPVKTFGDAGIQILLATGGGQAAVSVTDAAGKAQTRLIDLRQNPEARARLNKDQNIGIIPDKLTNQLGALLPKGPAAAAGLKSGDIIQSVDGIPIQNWFEWRHIIQKSPGKDLKIAYVRNGQAGMTTLRPDSRENGRSNPLVGFAGVSAQADAAWAGALTRHYHPGFAETWRLALGKTWEFCALTLKFFGKMLIGQASLSNISGPVTVADVAGKSAAIGLEAYLTFLALISVSLGVMNFLPIPVLDGGHLMYYVYEWVRGKPLSLKVQEIGFKIGLALMMALMFVAFFNDITRLLG